MYWKKLENWRLEIGDWRLEIGRRAHAINLQSLISNLFLLLLLTSCASSGQFRTPRSSQTPGAMSRQPAAVAFVELDANPAQYRGQLVRVTGAFAPLPEPECEPAKGPNVDWSLIDEELRLDVQGFERVVQLVPEGAQMTVDGFWQRYDGPVGCGKEPPARTLWYLRAVRLVQPNPLPELAALPDDPAATEAEPPPTPEEEETPTTETTPIPAPTRQTPTPDLTASPTPTQDADATPTDDLATPPTPDLTASPTPTPDPDETPEEEEGPTATPTPTPDGEEDPTAPPPEETLPPGDYPAPTPTTDPYPDD